MPRQYDDETRARAVRMFQDRIVEGGISQVAARREVGELLGVSPETIRSWVRRMAGEGATPPAGDESVPEEVARLRRENAQLKRANEDGGFKWWSQRVL